MKIKELISLDCRIQQNYQLVKQKLLELPFFKNFESADKITIEDLEDALMKMGKKYPVVIAYIMKNQVDSQYYTISINELEQRGHIISIWAYSIYEGFAKSVIFIYAYIKNTYPKNYKWSV